MRELSGVKGDKTKRAWCNPKSTMPFPINSYIESVISSAQTTSLVRS